jgi:hypothetical protein
MELTEAIKTKQQSPELVFPSKHTFNRREAFLKYRQFKERLAASLGLLSTTRIRVDVGDNAAIENGLAVRAAIVDAIETDDATQKIHADCSGDSYHLGQGLALRLPGVLSALAPASIAGRMKVEIFQAACNTLRTVAVRRRKWNLRWSAETC